MWKRKKLLRFEKQPRLKWCHWNHQSHANHQMVLISTFYFFFINFVLQTRQKKAVKSKIFEFVRYRELKSLLFAYAERNCAIIVFFVNIMNTLRLNTLSIVCCVDYASSSTGNLCHIQDSRIFVFAQLMLNVIHKDISFFALLAARFVGAIFCLCLCSSNSINLEITSKRFYYYALRFINCILCDNFFSLGYMVGMGNSLVFFLLTQIYSVGHNESLWNENAVKMLIKKSYTLLNIHSLKFYLFFLLLFSYAINTKIKMWLFPLASHISFSECSFTVFSSVRLTFVTTI